MSEGVLFPGDRSLSTEEIDIQMSQKTRDFIFDESIRLGVTIEDYIILALKKQMKEDDNKREVL